MSLCKLQPLLTMNLLQHGHFLLCSRPETALLKCPSDCLWVDGMLKSRIDEMSGLNSSIQLPWSNLTNNGCFVTSRKLGRTSTKIVFLLCIHLFFNSTLSGLAHTSSPLNISDRVPLFRQRKNRSMIGSRSGFHGDSKKSSWILTHQINTNSIIWHCLYISQSHVTLILASKVAKHAK